MKSKVANIGLSAWDFLANGVWEADLSKMGWIRREAYRIIQFFVLLGRNFSRDQILLRASAMTFTTLLTIVPLIGILFAFLKGFGLHDQILPSILNLITAQNEETSQQITELAYNVFNYIDQTNVTALGFVSFLIIVASVGSLLRASEHSFNAIWHVRRSRPFFVKIRDYTFIVIITPLLMFVGLSLQQAFSHTAVQPLLIVRDGFLALVSRYPNLNDSASYWLHGLDTIAVFGYGCLQLVPVLVIWVLFTLIYIYAPYTRVPIGAGMIGALVGAILWQSAYLGYINFQYGMVKYNKIYGTLASAPFSLMWVYISWTILLVGAQVAYVIHELDSYRKLRRLDQPSPASRERLAVRLMDQIAENFQKGDDKAGLADISRRQEIPEPLADEILTQLENAGLLIRAQTDDERLPRFVPSRPPNEITLREVIESVRNDGAEYPPPDGTGPSQREKAFSANENEHVAALERTSFTAGVRRLEAPVSPRFEDPDDAPD